MRLAKELVEWTTQYDREIWRVFEEADLCMCHSSAPRCSRRADTCGSIQTSTLIASEIGTTGEIPGGCREQHNCTPFIRPAATRRHGLPDRGDPIRHRGVRGQVLVIAK